MFMGSSIAKCQLSDIKSAPCKWFLEMSSLQRLQNKLTLIAVYNLQHFCQVTSVSPFLQVH